MLIEDMFGDISCSQNQVWARHILVEDETSAIEIKNSLNEGADFCQLANDRSTDPGTKSNCGDLGWFGAGEMVSEFEEVVFSLNIGETSDPVETQNGFHIIQVLGNEERMLSPEECDNLKEQSFQDWLTETRNTSDITIMDYWVDRVPEEPTLPFQTEYMLQQLFQAQTSPTLPTQQP